MANRDSEGFLDQEEFYKFLNKITGFIWAYAVTNPGVNALRAPVYAEMINLVHGKPVCFEEYLFDAEHVNNAFNNFVFANQRPITRAMLTWWEFQDSEQPLLELGNKMEIEHIYAKKRQEIERSLSNERNLESLGNKALLEKKINIRAADYKFNDKKRYYLGFTNNRNQYKEGTKNKELIDLANSSDDFTESDIMQRHAKIISNFIGFLNSNELLKHE
jgi:hypothetical protein